MNSIEGSVHAKPGHRRIRNYVNEDYTEPISSQPRNSLQTVGSSSRINNTGPAVPYSTAFKFAVSGIKKQKGKMAWEFSWKYNGTVFYP